MVLTALETKYLVELMDVLVNSLSSNGCNDFPVPNNAENWDLSERMEAWNHGLTVDEYRQHPEYEKRPKGKTINLTDWFLASYLREKIKESVT